MAEYIRFKMYYKISDISIIKILCKSGVLESHELCDSDSSIFEVYDSSCMMFEVEDTGAAPGQMFQVHD